MGERERAMPACAAERYIVSTSKAAGGGLGSVGETRARHKDAFQPESSTAMATCTCFVQISALRSAAEP
jgi:hypothetical protein